MPKIYLTLSRFYQWSYREGLNLQPTDYRSVALPSWATIAFGGRGRIRTSEAIKTADLQSASFNHSDTRPFCLSFEDIFIIPYLIVFVGKSKKIFQDFFFWWSRSDLNRGLSAYEAGALTNWATRPCIQYTTKSFSKWKFLHEFSLFFFAELFRGLFDVFHRFHNLLDCICKLLV